MWLASRLAQFSARHPQTPLNAVQEQEPSFSRHSVDLIILNVKAARLAPDDTVLFRESVFPVCSPALLPIATRAIDQCRLLQEAHENSPEIDWGNWARELGLPSALGQKIVSVWPAPYCAEAGDIRRVCS
jgi:LysR family glycine cleavage system transcriptional activator